MAILGRLREMKYTIGNNLGSPEMGGFIEPIVT